MKRVRPLPPNLKPFSHDMLRDFGSRFILSPNDFVSGGGEAYRVNSDGSLHNLRNWELMPNGEFSLVLWRDPGKRGVVVRDTTNYAGRVVERELGRALQKRAAVLAVIAAACWLYSFFCTEPGEATDKAVTWLIAVGCTLGAILPLCGRGLQYENGKLTGDVRFWDRQVGPESVRVSLGGFGDRIEPPRPSAPSAASDDYEIPL